MICDLGTQMAGTHTHNSETMESERNYDKNKEGLKEFTGVCLLSKQTCRQYHYQNILKHKMMQRQIENIFTRKAQSLT